MAKTSTAPGTARVTAKDATTKLAHRRMTVLELAERLGNVSEACRRGGLVPSREVVLPRGERRSCADIGRLIPLSCAV